MVMSDPLEMGFVVLPTMTPYIIMFSPSLKPVNENLCLAGIFSVNVNDKSSSWIVSPCFRSTRATPTLSFEWIFNTLACFPLLFISCKDVQQKIIFRRKKYELLRDY